MSSEASINNGSKPSLKFIVDGMLGKLCRWLRFMGFDSTYAGCEISDNEIIAISISQKRIIVTSDRELSYRSIGSLFITEKSLKGQIKQVLSKYPQSPELFLSRCSLCNGELESTEAVPIPGMIPESVYERKIPVKYCKDCGKYYWDGSHHSSILQTLNELTGDIF
jgi:uncharacterized protein with PIN domain